MSEAIAELRRRNARLPFPWPLHLPTSEEVDAAEEHLGVRFHPDYRRFLLEASDVTVPLLVPAPVISEAKPNDLVSMVENARKYIDVPVAWLPFCEDNGDFFCMDSAGVSSEVIYWPHDGTSDEKWPDLATWIEEVWIGEADVDTDEE